LDLEPPRLFLMAVIEPRILISLASLLVLLACSALISGAEVALFSLTKTDLDVEEDHPSHRKIRTLKHLLKQPQKLLATILIVNNLVTLLLFYYLQLFRVFCTKV